ncbi:MAG: zinc ribbon domain-containing protein [Euryarchaeota archaeon]|nr:zinc ribbon domain-containing protein [Euryarchaeota archaeon]
MQFSTSKILLGLVAIELLVIIFSFKTIELPQVAYYTSLSFFILIFLACLLLFFIKSQTYYTNLVYFLTAGLLSIWGYYLITSQSYWLAATALFLLPSILLGLTVYFTFGQFTLVENFFIFICSWIGFWLIFSKFSYLGWVSLGLAVVTGTIIGLLLITLLEEEITPDKEAKLESTLETAQIPKVGFIDDAQKFQLEAEKPKCSNCGRKIDLTWKLCPNCGATLIEKPACRVCGKELDTSWNICPYCEIKQLVKSN